MALPKISHPLFSLTIPSTKQIVKFRPYLVKEEKILLTAQESEDIEEAINAIKQVISNCLVDKVDIDKLAIFDLEYFFLKLRAKSIGEIIEVSLKDPLDNKEYEVAVDLNKVEVIFTEGHTATIKLVDKIGVVMRYPSFGDLKLLETLDTIGAVKLCLAKIFDGEKLYLKDDCTDEEVTEFLDSLSDAQLNKISEFFKTMPKLQYKISYKREDGSENSLTLEGLRDFFH